ncbi:MAG: hypothetical protein ACYTGQ_04805 [Planctomycetota bacterium]|jgi:hypothetical protein
MSPWISWLYQYGLGTLLFAFSLTLAIRSGALQLERPIDRRILVFLIAGLALFMITHAVWTAMAGDASVGVTVSGGGGEGVAP